jgi:protein phosphatase
MTRLSVKTAGLTDQGQVRTNNEDAVWVDPKLGLLIVADGMGGHQSGEVASGIAVSSIPENFSQLTKTQNVGDTNGKGFSVETDRLGDCFKAHVGDSRCYLIREGEMEQLTEDHTLEPMRNQNILTRSLGTQPEVQIDLDEHPLFAGDVLLLCSDGLAKELTKPQVLQTVMETPKPQELAQRLIDMANAAGGRDNITVAVARIEKAGLGQWIKGLFKK